MTEITLDYEPREQFIPFHQRKERYAVMVCHRRAGKTVAAVYELIIRALYTKKKNARYAYVAPFYSQAKKVAWEYLKQATEKFAVRTREATLTVELPNGAWISLYGGDNPDTMRGIYLDGVVLDEYGDCRPSLWVQVIRPCIADRLGWVLMIGTPKGKNHFHEIYDNAVNDPIIADKWFTLMLKASDSGILPPEEIEEMKALMDESSFDQEMECNFNAAIAGRYYAALIQRMELEGLIQPGACEYDPMLTVKVAADLGRNDNTAMWFWQETLQGINVINYYEAQGEGLQHYIDYLNGTGYVYEEIWLPHDAVAKTLATDRSTIEQFLDAGFPARKVPRLAVQHGIDAVRKMLPKVRIDAGKERCFDGVEALRAYRRQYNEQTKTYHDNPHHDWASDGADAFRYFSLVCKDDVKFVKPIQRDDNSNKNFHIPTLEELFKDRENLLARRMR